MIIVDFPNPDEVVLSEEQDYKEGRKAALQFIAEANRLCNARSADFIEGFWDIMADALDNRD